MRVTFSDDIGRRQTIKDQRQLWTPGQAQNQLSLFEWRTQWPQPYAHY